MSKKNTPKNNRNVTLGCVNLLVAKAKASRIPSDIALAIIGISELKKISYDAASNLWYKKTHISPADRRDGDTLRRAMWFSPTKDWEPNITFPEGKPEGSKPSRVISIKVINLEGVDF